MKETPMLMCGEMVRATFEDRKTETRRVMKPQPPSWALPHLQVGKWHHFQGTHPQGKCGHDKCCCTAIGDDAMWTLGCPYGGCGDRLWVRETWAAWSSFESNGPDEVEGTSKDLIEQGLCQAHISYRADHQTTANRWRPSIFMPRWASRITLEITDVRVQRVQEISEDDAMAEGIVKQEEGLFLVPGVFQSFNKTVNEWRVTAREAYGCLWDSLNSHRPGCSWSSNPFVWAIAFRRVK